MRPIKPTLTDEDVIQFCLNGYIMYEGVIPEEINRQVYAYLEEHDSGEPSEILKQPFFIDGVLLNETVAGAVRSLLGENFMLPHLMSNHRSVKPRESLGGWHWDAGAIISPPTVNYLQVFYLPQDVTLDMGPTAFLPGSHLINYDTAYMAHYGNFRNQFLTVAPAGSVLITAYPIWHRATTKTSTATRNLLKYNYWRTVPPTRDWITDPNFDPITADYKGGDGRRGYTVFSQPRVSIEPVNVAAEMFNWLSGTLDQYRLVGAQGWPLETEKGYDPDYTRKLVNTYNNLAIEMKDYKRP
ncbi:phytanoyl-CoA dioxygenase family protein [Paenibacillus montanisoli]|uniref:Phytanoyl-CoA dioxygenase n=1 Tax=Paenibacillus montanisoli TaxID=2081970 RepID=A0A328U7X1_9BACL|nr:phytanoyl-CoA dioxygenase family protein [Paenibacillus montanisoli]RAP77913.1 hypothetical protein DL346_05505 [Paenibacillus montanisoli]